ncbi:SHOCT domain-containing protein [Streptomyces sp. NPDC097981]|uniref:SHOCT domain-containing protein n=1 Tax=Streptomyces sp. NPDC097981 TaxID=3155428 RepID=UPI0033263E54
MYWRDQDMSGWGWFARSFTTLIFLALIVAVAVLLARSVQRPAGGPREPAGASPEQLLAERFALGEIDDEEYERRLAALRRHGPRRPGRGG